MTRKTICLSDKKNNNGYHFLLLPRKLASLVPGCLTSTEEKRSQDGNSGIGNIRQTNRGHIRA